MKIGIIITTFLRDELLFKTVQSILDNWIEGFEIIIVDQGEVTAKKHEWINQQSKVHYIPVLFNSGLSYGRNVGVQKAKQLGCEYILLSSDSFLFNNTIQKLPEIINLLNTTDYKLIGFNLLGSVCRWEGFLNLIEGKCFELDFVHPNDTVLINDIPLLNVECMRNFFLAKIDVLLNCKWDENLLLGEHEDMMYRLKLQQVKCGWTNIINATKMKDRPTEYAKFRKTNFNNGLQYLRKKYNISGWIEYKHHEYCHLTIE